MGGEKIVVSGQRIIRPNFVLPSGLDDYGKQLAAAEARYLSANGGLPGGYLFQGVTSPKALLPQSSLMLDGAPVVITPRAAKWLQPDQVFVVSGVSFEFLWAGAAGRGRASARG